MRVFILALPAFFMCGGVLWMAFSTLLLSQKTGRINVLRRTFGLMSIVVGGLFVVWAIAIMFTTLVHIAFPIVIGCVGLLLGLQGWAFNKLKLF